MVRILHPFFLEVFDFVPTPFLDEYFVSSIIAMYFPLCIYIGWLSYLTSKTRFTLWIDLLGFANSRRSQSVASRVSVRGLFFSERMDDPTLWSSPIHSYLVLKNISS